MNLRFITKLGLADLLVVYGQAMFQELKTWFKTASRNLELSWIGYFIDCEGISWLQTQIRVVQLTFFLGTFHIFQFFD
jgi:hypothetical protein